MDALCVGFSFAALSLAVLMNHRQPTVTPALSHLDRASEPPRWAAESISGELRLVDVTVEAVLPNEPGYEVAFDAGGVPHQPPIRLRRAVEGEQRFWKARLMGPSEQEPATAVFWIRAIGTERWFGPCRAVAAPPAELAAPAWALGAVWYQVFPERFANGNPRNDPTGPDVFRRPWNSAWESVSASELEAARARAEGTPGRFRFDPEQAGGALYQVATGRRYGGDLEGVHQQLDYLADLGVTAIYLNPVFDAPSMHKYDAADYRHIDPTLAGDDPRERPVGETLDPATWRWTSADRFLIDKLLPDARKRGMRVVLDGVWNHTSTKYWAFRDVVENGRSSAYSGWFQVSFDGDNLSGWMGWPDRRNGSLPQFARGADGNLVAAVRQHIADVTRRWMDPDGDGNPSDGIDGWRLDVAKDIPTSFWREWCPLVRSINPGAVMIGEVWFVDRERVGSGMFHGQMNYPLAMAAVKWLDGRQGFGADAFRAAVDAASIHPARINLAQMNLLNSHDTARLATMLHNPGRGYGGQEKIGGGAEGYRTDRPPAEVYDLAVLGVALQATLPGSPMVYAGEEWGVFGADDPDDRKPVPWPDTGPFDSPSEAPDALLRQRYREWLRLRQDPQIGQALRYGDLEWLETGDPNVVAFVRALNGTRVLIILNRGAAAFSADALARGHGQRVGPRSGRWWNLGDR